MTITFSLLSQLRRGKSDWAVKVRIARKWKIEADNKLGLHPSIELVLIDSEGSRIQATIPSGLMNKYDSQLKEFSAYGLSNLFVVENRGNYKITAHQYKLLFIGSTDVYKISGNKIPIDNIFNIKSIPEVLAIKDAAASELIDVIGRVVGRGILKTHWFNKAAKGGKFVKVELQDTSKNKIMVTLWEGYADKMLKHIQQAGDAPLIVLLQMFKPKTYEGMISLGNAYFGSEIRIQSWIPEFLECKRYFGNDSSSSQKISELSSNTNVLSFGDFESGNIDVKSVADLKTFDKEGTYWIVGQISQVYGDNWSFIGCFSCKKKLKPHTIGYKCEECNKVETTPTLRYQVKVSIISENESASFILWDDACYILIGKTAQELKEQYVKIRNYTLLEIEKVLRIRGKSLKDFPTMPYPDESDTSLLRNRLILDEMNYDRDSLAVECKKLLASCTDEQKYAYDKIIKSVDDCNGGVFFLYGSGGTGKTFLWRLLSASLRSKGDIVLNLASSGIASLLLPNGRTGHSRFAIPLVLHEDTTCNIKQGSPLAELIVKTKLIIWDEAPMVHKHCFEALDRTLRDIMQFDNPNSFNQPFGGKTIVFGGDFRQILPVIAGGTREDIVMATINTSHLWSHCIVLKLTKNMRLKDIENDHLGLELKNFSEWILSIGDGTYGGDNDGAAKIKVPIDLLVQSSGDLIKDIVESTYPEFVNHFYDVEFLQGRAILAPTLEDVVKINEYMVSYNQSDCKTYLSADSICTSENGSKFFDQLHSTEFLNTIRASGPPNHQLSLKVGVPVMLLRNIDPSAGLCNGSRLIITRLGQHIVEAKILNGNNVGEKVFVPRMSLTPSDVRLPFNFQRRQFPLVVSYAMTINKSQGQSLTHVGLFLRKPIFSHGQLYVALSRVTNRAGLKILVCDEEEKVVDETTNVVYKEVFQNL